MGCGYDLRKSLVERWLSQQHSGPNDDGPGIGILDRVSNQVYKNLSQMSRITSDSRKRAAHYEGKAESLFIDQ